jgi:hypothetical protein
MANAYAGLNGTAEHSLLGWIHILAEDGAPLRRMVVDFPGWDEVMADTVLYELAYERVGPWVQDGKDQFATVVVPERKRKHD